MPRVKPEPTGVERLRFCQLEAQFLWIDILEQAFARAQEDREDRDVKLVDEVVVYQGARESAGAVFDDVLAGLTFELSERSRDITLDNARVPGGLAERGRCDQFGHAAALLAENARELMSRPALDPTLSRIREPTNAIVTSPIGTFSQKIHCQATP